MEQVGASQKPQVAPMSTAVAFREEHSWKKWKFRATFPVSQGTSRRGTGSRADEWTARLCFLSHVLGAHL